MERGNTPPSDVTTSEPGGTPSSPGGGLVAPTAGGGSASANATEPRGLPPEDRGPENEPGGSPIHTNPEDLDWERIPANPGMDPSQDVGDRAVDENGQEWQRTRNPDGSTTSSLAGDDVNYQETVDGDGNRTRSFTDQRGGNRGWNETADGQIVEWNENNYGQTEQRIVNRDGSRTVLGPDGPPLR